jgi:hypothetical protein
VGIDVIAGSLIGSTLQRFLVINAAKKSSTVHDRFVQKQSNLNREVEESALRKAQHRGRPGQRVDRVLA